MAFRRRNKSYPFFSQEFLIQNHADIVFSLVIFILIGLMFEVSWTQILLFLPPTHLSQLLFKMAKSLLHTQKMWLGAKLNSYSITFLLCGNVWLRLSFVPQFSRIYGGCLLQFFISFENNECRSVRSQRSNLWFKTDPESCSGDQTLRLHVSC